MIDHLSQSILFLLPTLINVLTEEQNPVLGLALEYVVCFQMEYILCIKRKSPFGILLLRPFLKALLILPYSAQNSAISILNNNKLSPTR